MFPLQVQVSILELHDAEQSFRSLRALSHMKCKSRNLIWVTHYLRVRFDSLLGAHGACAFTEARAQALGLPKDTAEDQFVQYFSRLANFDYEGAGSCMRKEPLYGSKFEATFYSSP